MKLYYFPGSGALADPIVLAWIGAPGEAVKLDREGLKSPEFLALNPSGAVPVLVDGDFVLTQNVAILGYLPEQHPQASWDGAGNAGAGPGGARGDVGGAAARVLRPGPCSSRPGGSGDPRGHRAGAGSQLSRAARQPSARP